MNTITPSMRRTNKQRVERGATWLDQHMPTWHTLIDLDRFDLRSVCGCVLGQIVSDACSTYEGMAVNFTTADVDEQNRAVDRKRRRWRDDGRPDLADMVMTHREAVHRGFQLDFGGRHQIVGGTAPTTDLTEGDWVSMTSLWAVQILARRYLAAGTAA